ncbi:MAG: amidohydrolase family protein, partial [Candidatus Geothermarchaeales archaeon]
GWSDIWEAWGGVPGVETMLPLMLSEGVSKGRITIERLCQVLSTSPAKIFGLYPRKGAVAIGSDADLVLVDPKLEKKVKGDDLHSKCGWSPYEGVIFKGWPVLTMVRGEVIMEDGQVIGKPGHGRFVPQTLKPTREEA